MIALLLLLSAQIFESYPIQSNNKADVWGMLLHQGLVIRDAAVLMYWGVTIPPSWLHAPPSGAGM
jgi:hypothetical protein